MKKFIAILLFSILSISSFADTINAEKQGSSLEVLDRVVALTSTYSRASGLEAKVIELLGGDGYNPTRMVVVFNDGYDSKIFELGTMLYSVDRITFSDIDTLVINYTQDTIEVDSGDAAQVKRSLQIKILRDSKGQLTDNAITTDLK